MPRTIGCCSWSLRPESPEVLAARVREVGTSSIQLALRPLREGAWDLAETVDALRAASVRVASGMMETAGEDYSTLERIRETGGVRPDARWAENLEIAKADAQLAARLGLPLVTFHAGFLPHEPGAERARLVERLRTVHDVFADEGVAVGFETGQERAETLLEVLEEVDRSTVGVNFDPANMILYDMGDPVEALARLAPWVRQIHVKDAVRTRVPGEWGQEVRVGTGEVDWSAFFAVVGRERLGVDLMIEREAGEDRVGDMRAALEVARRELRPAGEAAP